jgi:uncharacterized sulfatase
MAPGALFRAVAAVVLLAAAALAQEARASNVLLITVDDLNTRLGAYGDARARTPNIDALAARGVRFERAYCQYPLCNPSRISLFSGLRPQRTRAFDLQGDLRDFLPEVVTLPEHFKRNGWTTARIGKVHHRNAPDDDPRSWDLTLPIDVRAEEASTELVNLTPQVRSVWGISYLESAARRRPRSSSCPPCASSRSSWSWACAGRTCPSSRRRAPGASTRWRTSSRRRA